MPEGFLAATLVGLGIVIGLAATGNLSAGMAVLSAVGLMCLCVALWYVGTYLYYKWRSK